MSRVKRYLAQKKNIGVIAIDATDMVREIKEIHNLSNVATSALGRVMIVTAMLASSLKNETDKITVIIKGDGPLGNITVCSNANLEIKGCISNPQLELPLSESGRLDVGHAIGDGTLSVIREIAGKKPYAGVCDLLNSEIGDDFAYYLNISEQVPSIVSIGVKIGENGTVDAAGGYLIQPLPKCPEKILSKVEQSNLKLPTMDKLMYTEKDIDKIVVKVTKDRKVRPVYAWDVSVKCDCSQEKIENTIISLGKEEAYSILKEKGFVELSCNFCNKKYKFNEQDLERIFSNEE